MTSILRTRAIMCLAWISCVGICLGWLTDAQGQTSKRGALVSNVKTNPASPRTGDKIQLLFDAGEDLVRAEITWTVNGNVVETSEYDPLRTKVELDHPIKAGDVIVASITPYEAGGTEGKKIEHRIVCSNAPPILSVVNQNISAGGVYTAKIEAKNPQGGAITLKLEKAPNGLTMDSDGNIQWQVGKDKSGRYSVKVVGEDELGQKTFLTYEIGIRWQQR